MPDKKLLTQIIGDIPSRWGFNDLGMLGWQSPSVDIGISVNHDHGHVYFYVGLDSIVSPIFKKHIGERGVLSADDGAYWRHEVSLGDPDLIKKTREIVGILNGFVRKYG
jgi:hypothetical protein